MIDDGKRGKLFTRRAAILAGVQLGMFGVLAGRMYYLQVIEADRYAVLSERNRVSVRLISPPRGPIVDRFGVPLAENRQNYRLVIVPERARDVDGILDALGRVVSISGHERRRVLRDVRRSSRFTPVTVRENLTWQEVAQVEVHAPDLPGAMIDIGRTRYYAQAEKAVHVVGYVAAVSSRDMSDDPFLRLPDARVGKSGVERQYDLPLRGSGGTSRVEVNAVGRVIRELERDTGEVGQRAILTLDMDLQERAFQSLAGSHGAAIVMDASNGEVLAMVSRPAFDPNRLIKGLSSEEWRALSSDPTAPMNNKALGGQYAPGSAFKMVVALAALEAGVVGPDFSVACTGHMDLGNGRFHCWKERGHGPMTMESAIRESCDIYFYEVARRLGVDRIAEMARRFGYGSPAGIDLPGESRGIVPDNAWKMGVLGTRWQKGETLILGIGQGYILATPLQMALATAAMVNGGYLVTPHVLSRVRETEEEWAGPGQTAGIGIGEIAPGAPAAGTRLVAATGAADPGPVPGAPVGVSPDHLRLVQEAMVSVVNHEKGTAFASRIRDRRFRMGGKTGTSQVRRISRAERETGVLKNAELPRQQRDHAVFVGFAPTDAPRYVATVVVEHGGSGSTAAAPIAKDLLYRAQQRPIISRDQDASGPADGRPCDPSRMG